MKVSVSQGASQGASQGRNFLAGAFDLARPGVAPPLVDQHSWADQDEIWQGAADLFSLPNFIVISATCRLALRGEKLKSRPVGITIPADLPIDDVIRIYLSDYYMILRPFDLKSVPWVNMGDFVVILTLPRHRLPFQMLLIRIKVSS